MWSHIISSSLFFTLETDETCKQKCHEVIISDNQCITDSPNLGPHFQTLVVNQNGTHL